MLHKFADSLSRSHTAEDCPAWLEIYRKAFPSMSTMISHREDGQHQRAGIDRSVILHNGKQVWIDEKARFRHYCGDILLEYLSNTRTGALGWVEKMLLCDYIAVAYLPSGCAFLLPVIQLQSAWEINREQWITQYGTIAAKNQGYETLNTPVPTNILFSAMGGQLRVSFNPVVRS